jgi:alpha-methylacyl-CoA racemase
MTMSIHANPAGPLAGTRIVEFAGIGPGPFAAMLLGDMGAEIVRIERPGTPVADANDFVGRSRTAVVQLDLKNPSARLEALALLEQADALIEGFRPGVMERLGLGPEEVLKVNPALVYGRMTGWGQDGPRAQAAGHDINYISLTGALAAMGSNAGPPAIPLNLVGDYGGGALYLVVGLLAGVLSSRNSGKGQVVDAAMCDGAASLMAHFYALRAQGRWTDTREDNLLDGGAPFYRTYACADGKFVAIGPIESQFYAVLRERLDLHDSIFASQNEKANWPAMRARLAEIFASRSRDEWVSLFEGSDGCLTPVLDLAEAPNHPHFAARHTFQTDANTGSAQPAPAPRFSRTPACVGTSPAIRPSEFRSVLQSWCIPKTSQPKEY